MLELAVFALIATKIVDTLRNAFDPRDRAPKAIWNLAAFAIGITIATIWELNVLPADGVIQARAGTILTGLGVGAVAGGWHELLDALHQTTKR